ncbi:hypothetical protein [Kutzneria albida]|uniref:hypothetical protein n=1 Tax=Kutzneria albida TaxID=43357 RepID=UPI0011DE2261|nr:hypothetical protein [Kutzneria albida]
MYSLEQGREICPECGSEQNSTDQDVERRINGYGADLVRLQERLEFAHGEQIAVRGNRLPEPEYRQWLCDELMEQILAWTDRLIPTMSLADFNDPSDVGTREAWTQLLELANDTIDCTLQVKQRPGPPQLVATHRLLIRGLLQL